MVCIGLRKDDAKEMVGVDKKGCCFFTLKLGLTHDVLRQEEYFLDT